MRTVERAAARAAERRAIELAAALARALPGVRVGREGPDLVLTAPGLARRLLEEPGLRDPAGLIR